MDTQLIDESFAHSWQVEVLTARPLISPSRHFVYPRDAEEVERGALELIVHPETGRAFRATCALGFADPSVPTGVWTCPHPDQLCAVAGGYAYLIDAVNPKAFEQVNYRPVLLVRAVPSHDLLLFGGHHALVAYGRDGRAWESPRLSWEGFEIGDISGNTLSGKGWDMMADSEVEFAVDLRTGYLISA